VAIDEIMVCKAARLQEDNSVFAASRNSIQSGSEAMRSSIEAAAGRSTAGSE
jgi:hypothetical protein